MYVVIIGDPFNGMRCYGPMDRIDAESLEADVYTDYEEPCCFIVKLHDPKVLP